MVPASRRSRLLLAVLAVPALTGCVALGLPEMPGTALTPFGIIVVEASVVPDASALPGGPSTGAGTIASADGYSLDIPGGWGASDLSAEDGLVFADTIALVEPILGGLGRAALESDFALQSRARLSLVAVDVAASATGGAGPTVVVATMRTRGMDKGAARNAVEDLLAQAPLVAEPSHSVEGLPAGDAHRYDATIASETGSALRLQIYVFRVGGDSFVIAAMAPEDLFDASQATFDSIIKSLRFGV